MYKSYLKYFQLYSFRFFNKSSSNLMWLYGGGQRTNNVDDEHIFHDLVYGSFWYFETLLIANSFNLLWFYAKLQPYDPHSKFVKVGTSIYVGKPLKWFNPFDLRWKINEFSLDSLWNLTLFLSNRLCSSFFFFKFNFSPLNLKSKICA